MKQDKWINAWSSQGAAFWQKITKEAGKMCAIHKNTKINAIWNAIQVAKHPLLRTVMLTWPMQVKLSLKELGLLLSLHWLAFSPFESKKNGLSQPKKQPPHLPV